MMKVEDSVQPGLHGFGLAVSSDSSEANGSAVREKCDWRGAPLKKRLAAFDRIYIKHKAVNAIVDHIERELVLRESKQRAIGVLVVAESGSGKSSLIKFLDRKYPARETETQSIRPVLCFKVPPTASSAALGEALLTALGDPRPQAGTSKEKKARAEILLCKAETIIVAIDDFQDVPARRQARGVMQVSDWFRDLCDFQFPGIVMALGTPDAVVVRDASHQLRRRMPARFNLPVFSMKSPEAEKTFRSFLKVLDKQLPFAELSNLDNQSTARALLAASNGVMDYLVLVLERALVRASDRSSERIDLCDLELGFNDTFQVAAEYGNPFSPQWDGESLTGANQAFAPSDLPSGGPKK